VRRLAVRYCPSVEFLSLIFGLLASAAINLLTGLVMGGVSEANVARATNGGLLLGGAAAAVGALVLITARLRSDALDGAGSTLSQKERRAQVLLRLTDASGRILLLELVAFASTILAGYALARS
jgi:hypothetical protein